MDVREAREPAGRRWSAAGLLLFLVPLAVACFLRFGDLESRPLHNDEAINATKLRQLWNGGGYRYDPDEYHGPTLYYFALPVLRLASTWQPDQPAIADFRLLPVLAGVALVLVVLLAADGLGRGGAWMAALLTAVSPSMVYYSRYFIHELLLVLASALLLGGLWRYAVHRRAGWALLAGVGVGLMWATKETFVFVLAAAGAAWWCVVVTTRAPGETPTGFAAGRGVVRIGFERTVAALSPLAGRDGIVAALAAIGVGALLLSSFGAHPAGVLDSLRTYFVWGGRAGGATPHVQPWYFYFERLLWFHGRGAPVWSEAAVAVLAVVGASAGFRPARPGGADPGLVRFLTVYTAALAGIYAVIPYKTPWCFLGFWHGAILLAGVGAAALMGGGNESRISLRNHEPERTTTDAADGRGSDRSIRGERFMGGRWRGGNGKGGGRLIVVGLLVAAAGVHLAVQAWRGAREYAADFRNPCVYGHTSADLMNLIELVEEVRRAAPAGPGMSVQVAVPESGYWPLPWYFRAYPAVGWWDALPAPPYASVVIAASKLHPALDEKTGQAWRAAGMFELRPRVFVEVFVEAGLWQRFLATRAAEREKSR